MVVRLVEVGRPLLEMRRKRVGPQRGYFRVEVEGLHQPDSEPSAQSQEGAPQRSCGRWLHEGELCSCLDGLAWYRDGIGFGDDAR